MDKCLSLQKKVLTGVTHQKYRLGVVRKLVGEVEVESDNKEEKGEVEDLNKVGLGALDSLLQLCCRIFSDVLLSWNRCRRFYPGRVGDICGESSVMWTAAFWTRTRNINTRNPTSSSS